MYRLCLKRKFIARHFLIGGDWGAETTEHSHSYELELRLSGKTVDRHNYLIDLVEIESILDTVIGKYRDSLLNSLLVFEGENPSIELFSKVLVNDISSRIKARNIEVIEVRLWENEEAWASWSNRIR